MDSLESCGLRGLGSCWLRCLGSHVGEVLGIAGGLSGLGSNGDKVLGLSGDGGMWFWGGAVWGKLEGQFGVLWEERFGVSWVVHVY
ncbi:hypothetical protein V6N12_001619 [Hibiscus sabdariffa]|uniref:Uncharacterized protein n=1 Tax=Hibiscus sabdariffa TaxID=183260 RepID=A0ABR2BRJ8_9ROSI